MATKHYSVELHMLVNGDSYDDAKDEALYQLEVMSYSMDQFIIKDVECLDEEENDDTTAIESDLSDIILFNYGGTDE